MNVEGEILHCATIHPVAIRWYTLQPQVVSEHKIIQQEEVKQSNVAMMAFWDLSNYPHCWLFPHIIAMLTLYVQFPFETCSWIYLVTFLKRTFQTIRTHWKKSPSLSIKHECIRGSWGINCRIMLSILDVISTPSHKAIQHGSTWPNLSMLTKLAFWVSHLAQSLLNLFYPYNCPNVS